MLRSKIPDTGFKSWIRNPTPLSTEVPHLLHFGAHHGGASVKDEDNVLRQRREIFGGKIVHEIAIQNLVR